MPLPFARIRQILTFAATLVGLVAELFSVFRPRHDAPLGGESEGDAVAEERSCEERVEERD